MRRAFWIGASVLASAGVCVLSGCGDDTGVGGAGGGGAGPTATTAVTSSHATASANSSGQSTVTSSVVGSTASATATATTDASSSASSTASSVASTSSGGDLCGDGLVTGTEACDDGNPDMGDGCADNCTIEGGWTCAPGDPSVCTPTCGDDMVMGAETCDGADLGGESCLSQGFGSGTLACAVTCDSYDTTGCVAAVCGDGTTDAGEDCDDGNTVSGDGCSATCTDELTEIEPNEDGTPSLGGSGTTGNDFGTANPDLNGAFDAAAGDVNILGAINPTGDEDIFPISNTTGGFVDVRFDVWNLDPLFGFGVACGTSIDTALTIRDAAGLSLAVNDDRNGAIDRCSGLTYTLAPGATVYAQLISYGDAGVIPSYGFQIAFHPIVCGDGIVGAGEQCDDGNTTAGDGCSATCTIEGLTAEVEPNNSFADADANAVQLTGNAKVSGSITDTSDEKDFFRLVLATPQVVHFETFDGIQNCSAATTTTLRLFDSAQAPIANDSTSGIASCSALTEFLAAGTYYVQVEESGTNGNVPFYYLQVQTESDTGTETEPNDTLATANANLGAGQDVSLAGVHQVNVEEDWFSVTLAAPASLRVEIVEGDAETCEGNGVDSRLTLYTASMTQLVDDDDDGRGFCSLIDGTGSAAQLDVGAHALAAGTYYIQVRASSFAQTGAGGQFNYRLAVSARNP